MKLAAICLVATLVSVASASLVPQVVSDKAEQLRFSFDDGDVCPDFLVRCIKDGDVTNPVGDIGNKSMRRKGLKCVQKHSKINTAECNAKYPIDCAAKCEAQASPI